MAGFRFRLATLLKLREQHRDECRNRLAKAHEAQQVLMLQRESLQQEIVNTLARVRAGSEPGEVNVDDLLRTRRHALMLRAQQDQLDVQLREVAEEIERRREAVVEADRALKVLVKLREKQLTRHQYEELRSEMRRFDEIAGRCTGREVVG